MLGNRLDLISSEKTFSKVIMRAEQTSQTSRKMHAQSADVNFSCLYISLNVSVTVQAPPTA